MLRVKMPQGILTGAQLEALADVADRYSRGFGHITTRQNVQFHFMRLHDVEPAMRRLADAGLTTREACGNSVRNITACPYAGVAADELFDVTPYAEALTRHLLRHPLSSTLPRKFKIGFEGCPEDHTRTGDQRHRLPRRDRADGDARLPRSPSPAARRSCRDRARCSTSSCPADEIFDVADAILRVFAALGDYQHKQRNRMKFLIKTMGWERWREEYDRALEATPRGGAARRFPSIRTTRRSKTRRTGPRTGRRPSRSSPRAPRRPSCAAPAFIPSRRARQPCERVRSLAAHQRPAAEAGRLRDRDRRRSRLATSPRAQLRDPRRSRGGLWRRHGAPHDGAERALPLGRGGTAARSLRRARSRGLRARRREYASQTSSAAPAPNRAVWR